MSYARDTGKPNGLPHLRCTPVRNPSGHDRSTPDAEPWRHLIGSLRSATVIHSFEPLGRSSAIAGIHALMLVWRLQVAFLSFSHTYTPMLGFCINRRPFFCRATL